jgi:predicted secreted protein with PEFG-CTERM motif
MKISKGHIENKLNFAVKNTNIFLILTIAVVITGTAPIFAEALEPLSVILSKDVYNKGDILVVFGNVPVVFTSVPDLTIQILFEEQIIEIAQIKVAEDGTYAKDFNTNAEKWAHDGQYTVKVFYTEDLFNVTNFQFFQNIVTETSSVFPIDIPNAGTFNLEYTASGFDIKDAELNQDRYSILIELTENSGGNLILKLPRESFDSKTSDGTDEIFIVLVSKDNQSDDFIEVQITEIETTSDFRTINLQIEEDEKFIEIIGTYVIPEFGSIVIMILLVAITSAIVISKNKSSFHLYPKI